jgi:glycosyltransferase involved in cell wall biosynthesis
MTTLISVVIPTFKRPALLDRCLQALALQDFDPNAYEIIVANDRPSEAMREVVEKWQTRMQDAPRIRYVPVNGTRGPAAARNRGWQAATGAVIAFTDDDTPALANWLTRGWEAMQEDVIAAWGYVNVPLPINPTDYELDASRLDGAEFVTANCFVRRDALERIGGFDERFTAAWREDSDLFFSLSRLGRIAYAPGAVVVHPVRPAYWGVSVQQQRKVQFDALLYKKHPRLYRLKIRAAPPWNYYAIISALLIGVIAAASQAPWLSLPAFSLWLALTLRFCLRRLRATSRSWKHLAEMLLTSVAIPPLAVFWRLAGAVKFRVPFI